MPTRRDLFVALLGGAVILTAITGLVVIESREGPRTVDVDPVEHDVQVQGEYEATAGQGTTEGDLCIPDLPETECRPAHTRLELRVDGLPTLADDLHYVAFLLGGPDEPWSFGPLVGEDGVHVLSVNEPRDSRSHERLVITMEESAEAKRPGAWILSERTVGPEPDGPVDLSRETMMGLQKGGGELRTSQTGAVTVSALVEARLENLPDLGNRTLEAWFVRSSGETTEYTRLGTFTAEAGEGHAILDVRRERVRVEEQHTFMVTLGNGLDTELPGFPVYASTLRPG